MSPRVKSFTLTETICAIFFAVTVIKRAYETATLLPVTPQLWLTRPSSIPPLRRSRLQGCVRLRGPKIRGHSDEHLVLHTTGEESEPQPASRPDAHADVAGLLYMR